MLGYESTPTSEHTDLGLKRDIDLGREFSPPKKKLTMGSVN